LFQTKECEGFVTLLACGALFQKAINTEEVLFEKRPNLTGLGRKIGENLRLKPKRDYLRKAASIAAFMSPSSFDAVIAPLISAS
jgi:hypothetical protein